MYFQKIISFSISKLKIKFSVYIFRLDWAFLPIYKWKESMASSFQSLSYLAVKNNKVEELYTGHSCYVPLMLCNR